MMGKVDTILHMINVMDYCKRQLTLVDSNMEMTYQEKTDRKYQLQHDLMRANELYCELTIPMFSKVA